MNGICVIAALPPLRRIGIQREIPWIAYIFAWEDSSHEYAEFEIDSATLGQCTGLVATKSYRGASEQDRLVFEGDRVHDGTDEYALLGVTTWRRLR